MNKLKKIREEANMSQTELGARVGISQRYVAFIESGDKTPSLKNAMRIAEAVGKRVEDIFLPQKCT